MCIRDRPYVLPTMPPDPPTIYPQVKMDPVPFPDPAAVGEILVLPQPPLPVSPPDPPQISIDGYGFISLPDIVPPPIETIPPDVTGLAPVASVIDTWYAAPVATSMDIVPGNGGGGLRDTTFEDRIELY